MGERNKYNNENWHTMLPLYFRARYKNILLDRNRPIIYAVKLSYTGLRGKEEDKGLPTSPSTNVTVE